MRKNTADVGVRRHGVSGLGKYIKFTVVLVVGLIRMISLLIYLLHIARQGWFANEDARSARGRYWDATLPAPGSKLPLVCGGAWAAEVGVVPFLSKRFIFSDICKRNIKLKTRMSSCVTRTKDNNNG